MYHVSGPRATIHRPMRIPTEYLSDSIQLDSMRNSSKVPSKSDEVSSVIRMQENTTKAKCKVTETVSTVRSN